MSVKGNREWLQRSLGNELGWDADMVLGVSDAIATAETREEVDGILQDYLGGSKEVHSIVQRFLGETTKGVQPISQQQAQRSNQHNQPAGAGISRGGGRQVVARERPAGSMTIIHTQKRKGAQAADAEESRPAPDRAVANCLCCGKVYLCRETTNDTRLFVESGGMCTFCGAKVALSSQESSQVRPPYADRAAAIPSPEQPGSSAPASAAADAEAAEAVALKNRLVDYDRNASRRTTVVDDQSDFFEIDSNAWLSDEERQQLKERQRAIDEAEQARRRAVTVTFDLLGRQVIMTGEEPSVPSSDAAASSAGGVTSAAAGKAARPSQGEGPNARAGEDAAEPARDTPMVLRIRPNPTLHGPAPVFMRRANGSGMTRPAGRQQQNVISSLPQQRDAGRLQHDDVFAASFGALTICG